MPAPRRNCLAYTLLLPAGGIMALCGILPMALVVYYSLHDTFGGNTFIWVGATWFETVLADPDFHAALVRSVGFSVLVLAIEIPLGIAIALRIPAKGVMTSLTIILITIPLLTPSIVVGYLWKALSLPKAGLLFELLALFGVNLDMNNAVAVWLVLAAMDAWHWTSLVILLCFAGLRAIPDEYYRAARIDGAGRWAVFRYIQLPKLRTVLLVAVLLRFMDSFIVYTEPYVVTHGGPHETTTFLSHALVQTGLVEFNLGEAGAMAIVYLLIVLCVSWAFFSLLVPKNRAATAGTVS